MYDRGALGQILARRLNVSKSPCKNQCAEVTQVMRSSITILLRLAASLYFVGLSMSAGAADEQQAARFYEDGAVRFEQKDYAAAAIQLKNALQQFPEHRPSHILLGRTYLAMAEPGAAEEHLLNARTLGADEALIVLPLAASYLAQRKYQEVILGLRYSGYAPDVEYRLRTYQGRAHTAIGEYDRAVKAYRDAQRLDPMAPEPLAGEALVLLVQGSVELARTKARVATERGPQSPEAWQAAAAVSHATGDVDSAVVQYGRVIALNPDHADARLARATLLLDLDRDTEAAVDIAHVREISPFEVRATYLDSVLRGKQGETKQARALLSETAQLLGALSSEVVAAEAGLQLLGGLANFGLKAYEQAEGFLKRFLANRPHDLGARRMLGVIFLARNDFAETIDILEPVLEETPNDPRVLHMIGRAYVRQQRYAEAAPLLERAVITSRGNIAVRTDLAFTRLALGQTAEALTGLRGVMGDDPSQMRAGIRLGALLLQCGEHAEVVRLARGMLEHHADSTVACNLLATAKFHGGEHAEAAVLFEQIAGQDPSFLPARANLAKIDVIEGRRAQARDRYLKILAEYPDHVATMLELARLFEQDGQIDVAIDWLNKALSANPKSVAAVENLVNLHLRAGAVELGLRVANEAESWAPENDRILLALSRAQLANKKPEVAMVILQGLAARAGYDSRKLMRVAAMQQRAEALDDAAYSLRKAVEGDPENVPARVELISVLLRLERLDRAMDAAQALRTAAPDSPSAYGALGEVLAKSGRDDEALEQFRRALDLVPADFTAIKYAQALQRVNPDAADKWLKTWVQGHPTHRLARQMIAERNMQRGHYDLARADYEQLVQWRPGDPGLLNNFAHVLNRLGDSKALEVAERAQKLAPDDPRINDTLGWMLVEAGDPQRGLAFLRNAHSSSGLNPEIRYHIGVTLQRLERTVEARRELESALASPRPFRQREAAVALLAELGK